MSLPLTGAGGVFTRLGHIIGSLNSVNVIQGTTLAARATLTAGDYLGDDTALISGLYPSLSNAQNSLSSWATYQQQLARSVLIQMAALDSPQPDSSLLTSLNYLIASMVAASASVNRSTVSATVTPGTNTGNGVMCASITASTGVPLENTFAESIAATVTRDSASGGATAGRETLSLVAPATAPSGVLGWSYPDGSGSSATVQAVSATSSNGSGTSNQLANSNFETWTVANIPDGWHIGTGTAGTQVLQSTSLFYDGLSSLQFAGDGTTLTSLYQAFGTDTQSAPRPLTTYVINFWCKVDSAPAAGVLRVALVDGSGTVINDAAGTANSFTVNLVTIGTSFVAVNGFFRTPRVLPASTRLMFKLTTALSNTKNLFIDRAALAQPTSLYAGGPVVAAFSGNAPWINGDSFALAVANNRAGAIQTGVDRLYGMRSLGLLLPSSGSPTISDSLVT